MNALAYQYYSLHSWVAVAVAVAAAVVAAGAWTEEAAMMVEMAAVAAGAVGKRPLW